MARGSLVAGGLSQRQPPQFAPGLAGKSCRRESLPLGALGRAARGSPEREAPQELPHWEKTKGCWARRPGAGGSAGGLGSGLTHS